MILKLNKSYLTRNRTIVRRILAIDRRSKEFPVVAELSDGSIFTYTKDGKHSLSEKEHPLDILEELSDANK